MRETIAAQGPLPVLLASLLNRWSG